MAQNEAALAPTLSPTLNHDVPGFLDSRQPFLRRRVRYAEGTSSSPPSRQPSKQITGQGQRTLKLQRRWQRIKDDLPPQLSRRHIGMISIGGVIGTGLFLGSADALRHGGPIGALLGYSIVGTVVYSLCVSIAEMIAYLPNVGGIVGLADLYVDPALGFSLGWAAWYNWCVTLPAEITAVVVVVGFWVPEKCVTSPEVPGCPPILHHHMPVILSVIFLILAIFINCFSSRVYGECELWFSAVKAITIVFIILACLLIDLGVGREGLIGFHNWKKPFAESYYGIEGAKGRFLGFWAVLMQASFSFFGSEVPGIAAGEVIDATRNVPRALRRVWLRITVFYVGGILAAGLVVPSSHPDLSINSGTSYSSPFVIAFKKAGIKWLSHLINAAVLLSAWSAAASDIYIGSRFLFFLARCKHAPQVFASLLRYPSSTPDVPPPRPSESDSEESDSYELDELDARRPLIVVNCGSEHEHDCNKAGCEESEEVFIEDVSVTVTPAFASEEDVLHFPAPAPETFEPDSDADAEYAAQRPGQPWFVLPVFAVLGSASVGLLSLLSTKGSGAQVESHDNRAAQAFGWLVAVASVASLQSWAAMLFTYVRWYQGTMYAEKKHKHSAVTNEESHKVMQQIKKIKVNRHWGQPYVAWYAFSMCMILLCTNGLSVFIHNGWRIACIPGELAPQYGDDQRRPYPVSTFLSSYVPIPFFILLTFGYKLINQTKMIKVEDMDFTRGEVNEEEQQDPVYENTWRRFLGWLLVN